MTSRLIVLAAPAFAVVFATPTAPKAQSVPPSAATFTEPLAVEREQIRPTPRPCLFRGDSRENRSCSAIAFSTARRRSQCNGWDAKGTPVGDDLTTACTFGATAA
jgi:hypothetical protein